MIRGQRPDQTLSELASKLLLEPVADVAAVLREAVKGRAVLEE